MTVDAANESNMGWIERYRMKARAAKATRPPTTTLWAQLILAAWVAVTVFLVMNAIMNGVPSDTADPVVSEHYKSLAELSRGLVWAWFLLTGIHAAIVLSTGGLTRLVGWWAGCARAGSVGFLLLGATVGALLGGGLFSVMTLQGASNGAIPMFGEFVHLEKRIPGLMDHKSPEAVAWFGADGQLKAESKQAWCDNALSRVDQFAAGRQAPGQSSRALGGILAIRAYDRVWQYGCLTDAQWYTHTMDLFNQMESNPDRLQIGMQKLSWYPVFSLIVPAHEQILNQARPTAEKVCLSMMDASLATRSHAAAKMICIDKYAGDRALSPQRVQDIRQELKAYL